MANIIDTGEVCFFANLQAWTSLSFSIESGRLALGTRLRTISPSIGSIRLNTSRPTQGRGAIASPVPKEDDKSPIQYKDFSQSALEIETTDSRKVGVRKSLHGVSVLAKVPAVEIVGAEFEDDEQGTANSDPS